MKIVVFGAGSLGSVVGGLLQGPNEVVLIARKPHVDAIRKSGLHLEGLRTRNVTLEARTELQGDEDPQLLLLTTKAYDTAAAIEAFRDVVSSGTTVCSIQNGVGNYEALREAFPKSPVLGASATIGALLEAPGVVRYSGKGEFLVGGTPHDLSEAGKVARALREAGFQALGVPEIRGPLWQKAIVNAAINPLSALEGLTNGELIERQELRARMQRIAEECAAIARAQKIALPEKEVFRLVMSVAEKTAENRSSMLQSLERKRKTEIDAIVGAFLKAAERLKMPAPECKALYEAVKAKEQAIGVH